MSKQAKKSTPEAQAKRMERESAVVRDAQELPKRVYCTSHGTHTEKNTKVRFIAIAEPFVLYRRVEPRDPMSEDRLKHVPPTEKEHWANSIAVELPGCPDPLAEENLEWFRGRPRAYFITGEEPVEWYAKSITWRLEGTHLAGEAAVATAERPGKGGGE